jgi:hypothetical protein
MYRVNTPISYPVDAEAVAQLQAAGPDDKARLFHALVAEGRIVGAPVGAVVDNIPAASIPWLLEAGYIAAVTPDTVVGVNIIPEDVWADLGRPDEGAE